MIILIVLLINRRKFHFYVCPVYLLSICVQYSCMYHTIVFHTSKILCIYIHCTVQRNITHSKEFAGNQARHRNFHPSVLPYKFGLIFMGMKKKNQNGRLKKTEFFNSANSQYFFAKISWIGSWVSRINWCEWHWCGLTYIVVRLSYVSSKTG